MVPEGWQRLAVGDVCKVVTGSTPATANEAYFGGNIPFVTPSDLGNRKVIVDAERTLSHDGARISRVVPVGSTLFVCIGSTIGKIGLAGRDLVTNQQINSVLPSKGTSPEFVYYQLAMRSRTIARRAGTQAVPLINKSQFSDELIDLPPLPEQNKIAEILSTWDKAIETVEKLLANSENQKRALARQLLTGNVRLNGLTDEPWKNLRMGDLFTERNERGGDDLPLLSITSTKGVIPQSDVERRNISREDKSTYKRIVPGDIGYNTMRMWQGVSALSRLNGLVSPAYTILRTNERISPEFAEYLFKLPSQVNQFKRFSQGLTSDQWNLKFKHFREVPAYIPASRREQDAISQVISDAISLCSGYRVEAESLRYEKRALMQELLTGKRRVFP